ncbi:MAG: hypothetical protein AABY01_02000 [Nanoarchaeota archaeon]
MNAREFLALSDQLAAFQAAMSGALKKEADEARASIQALDDAHNLVELEAKLAAREAAFAANRASAEASLNQLKSELDEKEVQLSSKEAELDLRETTLDEIASSNQAIIDGADLLSAEIAEERARVVSLRAGTMQELDQRESALEAREIAVTAREENLHRKLEALKEPV